MQVSAQQARADFDRLLEAVEHGERVDITRDGTRVAQLVRARPDRPGVGFTPERLAELARLRERIKVDGEPLSETVTRMRGEA